MDQHPTRQIPDDELEVTRRSLNPRRGSSLQLPCAQMTSAESRQKHRVVATRHLDIA